MTLALERCDYLALRLFATTPLHQYIWNQRTRQFSTVLLVNWLVVHKALALYATLSFSPAAPEAPLPH